MFWDVTCEWNGQSRYNASEYYDYQFVGAEMGTAAAYVCFVTMWIVATAAMLIVFCGTCAFVKGRNGDFLPSLFMVVAANSLWLRICLIVCFPIMYYRIN